MGGGKCYASYLDDLGLSISAKLPDVLINMGEFYSNGVDVYGPGLEREIEMNEAYHALGGINKQVIRKRNGTKNPSSVSMLASNIKGQITKVIHLYG